MQGRGEDIANAEGESGYTDIVNAGSGDERIYSECGVRESGYSECRVRGERRI
ncbi:unnamed protein product [Staurois parvus]|uniref:Uncharacterized protein n=1 Tax=Staurois parvus TaxID=386267 RepID=A0ABN9D8A2_9NEOB|nr:unnamed protein product [Staurois parvus]